MESLTPRQRQVLRFIQDTLAEQGMPPTRAEIAEALGFRSANAAEEHLRALQRKGVLELRPGTSRGIQLRDSLREQFGLPLIGRVAAGRPILAEENVEELVDVPAFLRRDDDDFVLRVSGDSMIGAGIFDSDLIVVHPQAEPRDGEIVVARVTGIGDDEATAKRIYRDGAVVRLVAENENYEPIVVNADQVEVVGRVVGVLRQL
jgi:repressor LexA